MEYSNQRKELKVSAIENGTVIDHIPANSVFRATRILRLDKMENQVLVGTYLDSKKYGKKGIIKVSNTFFKDDEINKIALVAPSATLIVIRDFKVVEKKQVEIPKKIEKIVKCVNPNCITNHENIPTKFDVMKNENGIYLTCLYCDKNTSKENMVFL
ncbi:MAG: aspartate carbamoyltransferase regulatory subunit [Bacteroidales bacterium]|mgnify:CR=1 FL=1|jgi:aspartate carbamoyltransferase regulatory subunit|nr:aspartate carbamoyltransferase regulatory subunit [Bacteroidales bacterium]MDI9592324.1 aspartate carbamoyltransferase regulatory subunit [Bacteroidota bacterium]NLH33382.1 aspartate carbamoyltransferase regulatory subunit [Lentimicrobium sp.]OQC37317.1 MAG: Aspartate carbamoyltransferase regulatory chain [Bacteroidetes bacterium ADurb.Bin041]MBP7874774.1 aspartate carbamoyltransferase regulatory subunit [Bacteroidales bacterium]